MVVIKKGCIFTSDFKTKKSEVMKKGLTMKNLQIQNETKKRKATANEAAKYLIIRTAENLVSLHERDGFEDLTDKEADEVLRHYEKHLRSLKKKFNPNNDIFKLIY